MTEFNLKHLHKKWVHSKEEDTETEMVYRPSTFKLPPVRGGRVSLDIKSDGTLITTGEAGADDRQEQKTASWRINEDTLELNASDTDKKNLKILVLDKEKLVIKK
jgi:hypothetical protein